jgi:hypothetical protein
VGLCGHEPRSIEQFRAIDVNGEETRNFFLRRYGSAGRPADARVPADASDVAARGAVAGWSRPLNGWYAQPGRPLALWIASANDVCVRSLDAGHFFPEEIPERTAEELSGFFAPS